MFVCIMYACSKIIKLEFIYVVFTNAYTVCLYQCTHECRRSNVVPTSYHVIYIYIYIYIYYIYIYIYIFIYIYIYIYIYIHVKISI